jgi:hypothetical protein
LNYILTLNINIKMFNVKNVCTRINLDYDNDTSNFYCVFRRTRYEGDRDFAYFKNKELAEKYKLELTKIPSEEEYTIIFKEIKVFNDTH